jgi:hypothetical protein
LELASSASVGVLGREMKLEFGNDFRVRWTADAEAVSSMHECLLGVKRAAGFRARERPTVQQVEQVIDELLARVDGQRSVAHILPNPSTWEHRVSAA